MTFVINYEKYKNKIFNYIYYRVGMNKEVAEDLTSEIFFKAFDNYDLYEKSKPFQSWIYAIAHNHLVNYYRDSKNNLSVEELTEDGYQIPDKSILDKNINDIDVNILLKDVLRLSKTQADVIMMRFLDQLTFSEIGEVINQDESNARVICHRAIKNLQKILNT